MRWKPTWTKQSDPSGRYLNLFYIPAFTLLIALHRAIASHVAKYQDTSEQGNAIRLSFCTTVLSEFGMFSFVIVFVKFQHVLFGSFWGGIFENLPPYHVNPLVVRYWNFNKKVLGNISCAYASITAIGQNGVIRYLYSSFMLCGFTIIARQLSQIKESVCQCGLS